MDLSNDYEQQFFHFFVDLQTQINLHTQNVQKNRSNSRNKQRDAQFLTNPEHCRMENWLLKIANATWDEWKNALDLQTDKVFVVQGYCNHPLNIFKCVRNNIHCWTLKMYFFFSYFPPDWRLPCSKILFSIESCCWVTRKCDAQYHKKTCFLFRRLPNVGLDGSNIPQN